MSELWERCQDELRKSLPDQQFRTWIKPLAATLDGDTLTLTAPNRFVLEWVRDKFLRAIEELASRLTEGSKSVSLLLAESPGRHQIRPRDSRGGTGPAAPGTGAGARDPGARAPQPVVHLRQFRGRAKPTSSPALPPSRSANIPVPRTTRCSSMAASASARPT